MASNWRRFEVLLPLQFNDGRDVPPDWLAGRGCLGVTACMCLEVEGALPVGRWLLLLEFSKDRMWSGSCLALP